MTNNLDGLAKELFDNMRGKSRLTYSDWFKELAYHVQRKILEARIEGWDASMKYYCDVDKFKYLGEIFDKWKSELEGKGEIIEEIPQFKGTLDSLDKLTKRKKDND